MQKNRLFGAGKDYAELYQGDYGSGQLVYAADRQGKTWINRPLINPLYGNSMNQSAVFSGTPDLIHNGGDSAGWVGSALSGTWDFASATQAHTGTNSIDATAAIRGNEALLSRASAIDVSDYVCISGWIYIAAWPASGTKDVEIRLRLSGVDVGVPVLLQGFIDFTLTGAWQSFILDLGVFGASGNIDEIIIKQIDSGVGLAPTYFLDDIQLEEDGGAIDFEYSPGPEEVFRIEKISWNFRDAYTGGFEIGTFLGLSALTNGFLGFKESGGVVFAGSPFTEPYQMLQFAVSNPVEYSEGAAESSLKISSTQNEILDGRTQDKFVVRIQDDMSGLTDMNVWLYGSLEAV